ncbi:hypothetical protein EX30DRAFT_371379 [Ascodesmis nigricans]|uniref:MIT domain-containing protein n=1 Tax=Ascodesmis nigricans TaxID=341454 RepID=A0A4S2MXI6_9PEZI|nr:hypothetical protein EX30DRAFT_371379 [Ascodesmis nigricans]
MAPEAVAGPSPSPRASESGASGPKSRSGGRSRRTGGRTERERTRPSPPTPPLSSPLPPIAGTNTSSSAPPLSSPSSPSSQPPPTGKRPGDRTRLIEKAVRDARDLLHIIPPKKPVPPTTSSSSSSKLSRAARETLSDPTGKGSRTSSTTTNTHPFTTALTTPSQATTRVDTRTLDSPPRPPRPPRSPPSTLAIGPRIDSLPTPTPPSKTLHRRSRSEQPSIDHRPPARVDNTVRPATASSHSRAPVLPDLNLCSGADDFALLVNFTPTGDDSRDTGKEKEKEKEKNKARLVEKATPPEPQNHDRKKHSTRKQRKSASKAMLASALQRANTAVTLDNAENYEGAMEAYNDACVLLAQVMARATAEEDRRRLQMIRETYTDRINQLKQMPPKYVDERELPPRPDSDEYDDDPLMYEDDDSTLGPSNAPSIMTYGGGSGEYPQRMDSMMAREEHARAMGYESPLSRSSSSEDIVPAPLSPQRWRAPSRSSSAVGGHEVGTARTTDMQEHSDYRHRDSVTFNAQMFSPRYDSQQDPYGVQRSLSNGSNRSARSYARSSHSRGPSGEVSWLNTIDESGSSAGELSPRERWRPRQTASPEFMSTEDRQSLMISEDQLNQVMDEVVEAAWDDGYVVDDEYVAIDGPVQREMSVGLQRDKLEGERGDYFGEQEAGAADTDDLSVPSEEDEILRDLAYDTSFDFQLGSMTSLPRQSVSTQYTNSTTSTLSRESMSSGYSSGLGTTWGSSRSGHMTLTTVEEAPATPPPNTPLPALPSDAKDTLNLNTSPSKPPPPPPVQTNNEPVAPLQKTDARNKRLSALSEGLEPLKITTDGRTTPSALGPPTTQPPPVPSSAPPVPPLTIPPKSPLPQLPTISRPGTSHNEPEITEIPRQISSPTPNEAPGGFSTMPLTKTVSNDAASIRSGSDSSSKFPPKVPSVPTLRQIHSSASLRSRNYTGTPEPEMPPHTGIQSNLVASSSMTNLRRGLPRSGTPSTPVPTTPGMAPGMLGLATPGMNLFDSAHVRAEDESSSSFTGEHLDSHSNPVPLEPCPLEPAAKPYWLMRALFQTVTHPRGGYISTRLFIPREVWYIKGVKLKAIDDKISSCDLLTAALGKLATVNQSDIAAIHDEMAVFESVLDRVQTVLTKRLGNDVGPESAAAAYAVPNGNGDTPEAPSSGRLGMNGEKRSYFSIRKRNRKATGGGGSSTPVPVEQTASSVPLAKEDRCYQQVRRNLEGVVFGGPHAAYIAALARLFDAAQILDRLQTTEEDMITLSPKPVDTSVKIGLELSHRHAAEFFGFYVCRFVLTDIGVLMDKFVKRGSEWVAQ